jgi:hypothetical protein
VADSCNGRRIHELSEPPTEFPLRQVDGRDGLWGRALAADEPCRWNAFPRVVGYHAPPFEPDLPLTEGSSLIL